MKYAALLVAVCAIAAAAFYGWSAMTTSSQEDPAAMELAMAEHMNGIAPTGSPPTDYPPQPDPVQQAQTASTETGAAALDVDKALDERAIGNPDAPVKIVEYASLTCHHCADFHTKTLPQLKQEYIDTGKVYFVFQEFPLNAAALKGTVAARCLPEERYYGFISLLFDTQEQWSGGDYMAALRQNAKLAGLNDAAFDACMNSKELSDGIAASMQAASEKWEINATPTFVLNDGAEIVRGAVPFEKMKETIDTLLNKGAAPQAETESAE